MPITARPEVLRPGARSSHSTVSQSNSGSVGNTEGGLFSDQNLDRLSHLLDDFLHIPGTPIRFGLDGIAGFIPGIGDIAGGLASSIIIVAAWKRGVPRITVLRMVLNVAIETLAGAVPWIGNFFDIAWRANRRNYALLTGSIDQPSRHTSVSWLFLAGICAVLAVLMVLPLVLIGMLLAALGSLLGIHPGAGLHLGLPH